MAKRSGLSDSEPDREAGVRAHRVVDPVRQRFLQQPRNHYVIKDGVLRRMLIGRA